MFSSFATKQNPKKQIMSESTSKYSPLAQVQRQSQVEHTLDKPEEEEYVGQGSEKLYYSAIVSYLEDEHRAKMLSLLDRTCQEQECVMLPVDVMTDLFRQKRMLPLNKYDKFILCQTLSPEKDEIIEISETIKVGDTNTIIRNVNQIVTKLTYLPLCLYGIVLDNVISNYPDAIEIRAVLPSGWSTEWTVWSLNQTEEGPKHVSLIGNLFDKPKLGLPFQICGNLLWKIYVVGTNLDRITKDLGNGYVLLKRNVATVIIMGTILESRTTDRIKNIASACCYNHDGKHFKLRKHDYDIIRTLIQPHIDYINFPALQLELRPFNGGPWFQSNDNEEQTRHFDMRFRPIFSGRINPKTADVRFDKDCDYKYQKFKPLDETAITCNCACTAQLHTQTDQVQLPIEKIDLSDS